MDRMEDQFCVPDFEMDEDYFMPSSSSLLTRTKKSAIVEDETAELLWQNGEVVVQRSGKASHGGSNGGEAEAEAEVEAKRMRSAAEETARQHVFMQEDELASWLHYSLDEPEPKPEPAFDHYHDSYADFLYPPPFSTAAPSREIRTSTAEIRPQPPPPPPPPSAPPPNRSVDLKGSTKFRNFGHFSRIPKAASASSSIESGPSSSSKAAAVAVEKESTVVESSNAPPLVVSNPRTSTSHVAPNVERVTMSTNEAAVGTSTTARELTTTTCERTATSSPSGSGASASPSGELLPPPSTVEDRKRKGRETDDNEDNSVGIDESGETKKQARGSTSSKKSRAAEVHNLSERRRRDRINEKMRALQELIPRCNKSDKASMLDEAIEYLKSLQLQVQMMSMGYSMVPMMYPGVQHYMPAMGIGMGMGMDMGVNRPMVPYPHLLSGSAMPNPAAAAHMGPRFPMPAFHMPPVPVPDPSTSQASIQSQSRFPNFVDPYQQYLALHQGQIQIPQNQAVVRPSTEKPSSSRRAGYPENHQPGG